MCRNQDQLSAASLESRTCLQCGKAFASRNQLMRHVQSLAHYGEENAEVPGELPADGGCITDQVKQSEGCGSEAWDLYYQDLPDFQRIRSLMRTPVAYCFRSVPTSPLSDLAMSSLHTEAALKRPQGLAVGAACDCWVLSSESWNLLQAAQDCGAIQRQEAASMVPVKLLQATLEHGLKI